MLRRSAVILMLLPVFSLTASARQADSSMIRKAFNKADAYMNTDHYDSAQFYLNKIYTQVSYREPSLFSYFLTSRQAEIYYYNNLPELGLQEAQRAITIAGVLNDNILKGDAWNFAGLFYFLTGKNREAISFYKKSISLALSPPYPPKYLELSEPQHFYGNLAEVYEQMGVLDSAIHFNRLSIFQAEKNNSPRGLSTAYLNLANTFLKDRKIDSAARYYGLCRDASVNSEDFDVELNAYGGLASCADRRGLSREAELQLQTGFRLIREFPQVNSYYSLLFMETAIAIFQKSGNFKMLSEALIVKTQIQSANHNRNDIQIRNILMAGLKNETRILNLEITRARQKQDLATARFYFITALGLLLAFAFAGYFYYSRQRLRLLSIRNKISQDLHDEVGATLSGIALYAHLAQTQSARNEPVKAAESLGIINVNAQEMVKKLSDIVWAVNPSNDSFEQLMQRLENYAIETGSPKGITVSIHHELQLSDIRLSMELRKNIYLIGMEAVNNAIKYSSSQSISIGVSLVRHQLRMLITDDGTGFDPETIKKGNGLYSMQKRAAEIGGALTISSAQPSGTQIQLVCKIA